MAISLASSRARQGPVPPGLQATPAATPSGPPAASGNIILSKISPAESHTGLVVLGYLSPVAIWEGGTERSSRCPPASMLGVS